MPNLPAQMTVVAISKPGGPEVLVPETRALPVRVPAKSWSRSRPPASIALTSRSAPAPIRRRPARATCPASRSQAKWSRSAKAQSMKSATR